MTWAERSTAPGVFFSARLDQAGDPATYALVGDNEDHLSFDSSLKPDAAAAGSMKVSVLNADSSSSGSAKIPFGQDFGAGSPFWLAFSCHAPPNFCYQPWPVSSGEAGHKLAIISHTLQSNRPWEVVWQNAANRNTHRAYWQDGVVTAVHLDSSASTACSASDFRQQPAIDNGANPLSGTDPDSGSAWSSCQQDRKRYGSLYSGGQSAVDFAMGYGDPLD